MPSSLESTCGPPGRLHDVFVQAAALFRRVQVDFDVARDDGLRLAPDVELVVDGHDALGDDLDDDEGLALLEDQLHVLIDGVEVGGTGVVRPRAVGVDEGHVSVDLFVVVLDVDVLADVLGVDGRQLGQEQRAQVLLPLRLGAQLDCKTQKAIPTMSGLMGDLYTANRLLSWVT